MLNTTRSDADDVGGSKGTLQLGGIFHVAPLTSWNQASKAFLTADWDFLPARGSTKRVSVPRAITRKMPA